MQKIMHLVAPKISSKPVLFFIVLVTMVAKSL